MKNENTLNEVRKYLLKANQTKSEFLISPLTAPELIDISIFALSSVKVCEAILQYILESNGLLPSNKKEFMLGNMVHIIKTNNLLDKSIIEYLEIIIKTRNNLLGHGYFISANELKVFFDMYDTFVDWFLWNYLDETSKTNNSGAAIDLDKLIDEWRRLGTQVNSMREDQNKMNENIKDNTNKIHELTTQIIDLQKKNKIGIIIFVVSLLLSIVSILGIIFLPVMQNEISMISSAILAVIATIGGINLK